MALMAGRRERRMAAIEVGFIAMMKWAVGFGTFGWTNLNSRIEWSIVV
jgi:hypothetical protein